MAQQLSYELQSFYVMLAAQVAAQRQQRQRELDDLQAETQAFLDHCQEQRLHMHLQMAEELAMLMEELRSQVHTELTDLANERQVTAQHLRAQLQAFRTDLRRQVWSDPELPTEAAVTPIVPSVTPATVAETESPNVESPNVESPESISTTIAQPAAVKPPLTRSPIKPPRAKQFQKRITTKAAALEAIAQLATPASEPAQTSPSLALIPVTTVPQPPATPETSLATEICQYLQALKGARLTEIECALGLSRVQAVDALRSLIKQGIVTQRDRLYLVQS